MGWDVDEVWMGWGHVDEVWMGWDVEGDMWMGACGWEGDGMVPCGWGWEGAGMGSSCDGVVWGWDGGWVCRWNGAWRGCGWDGREDLPWRDLPQPAPMMMLGARAGGWAQASRV